ncbi:DMT family transporter [Rhodovibrionaceae bacterium A322]
MTSPDRSSTSTSRITDFALLGLLALLWGASYLFIKVAVSEIPPLSLIAARVGVAALFLCLVMAWRGDHLPRDARTWRQLLLQSFLNSFGAWTLLAWGQQYLDSGLAAVLNSTSPLFVFFITLLVTRHESLSVVKLFGALLGLLGVILIVGVEALDGLGQQVAGQLAALAGAFLYACAAINGKKFSHISATATAAGTLLWATVVLLPLALVLDQPWTLRPSATALGATLMLSIFSTAVALLIYFRLLRSLGSLGTASQAYLRVAVGLALGMVVLGEQLSLTVWIGLLAAMIGVAALNMPHAKPKGR